MTRGNPVVKRCMWPAFQDAPAAREALGTAGNGPKRMFTGTTKDFTVSAHLEMWVDTSFLLTLGQLFLSHLPHLFPLSLERPPSPDWMRAEVPEVSQHVLGHLTRGAMTRHEIGNYILFSQVARKDEWQGVDGSPDPNRIPAGEMQRPPLELRSHRQ